MNRFDFEVRRLFFSHRYSALALAWLLLISLLTVINIAPKYLNADTLMHSVMSLQNVTLYYWGQNRLLNVLPAAASLIKSPSINLAAILILSSLFFFAFLYVLSRAASKLIGPKIESLLALNVFIIISTIFVLIFTPHAVSEIAIGHIEYSVPALLFIVACIKIFSMQIRGEWKNLIVPTASIFLAIGINPATVIPAFFVSIASATYNKKAGLGEIALLLASGISFFLWNFISKQHGEISYNVFEIAILNDGLYKAVVGMLSAVDLTIILSAIAIFYTARICCVVFNTTENIEPIPIIRYINYFVILFSIGWLLLFSSSKWVEMNGFAWRYFIYIFFSFAFIFAIYIAKYLKRLNSKKTIFLTFLVALSFITQMFLNMNSFHFKDYKVFQRVNSLTQPGGGLYSGDYWVVWPSVLRDMMSGYEAYGLTYRGESNNKAARDFVLREINKHGRAKVHCLNDIIQNCISQINVVAGPFYVLGSTEIKSGVNSIEISDYAPLLDFRGESLLRLPSQVGAAEGFDMVSQQRAGYLLFGPYVPLKAGKYHLSVAGQATQLGAAYVDVVSDKGANVHARFNLKKNSNNFLIDKVEVNLSSSVNDLEVRVWVGEGDALRLHGYSLKPY